jgi:mxaJ protein
MYSVCLKLVGVLALTASALSQSSAELRVCADPENPPFSDRAGRGFENQIARIIGQELKLTVRFVWSRMGRGFVRNFLNGNECDLVIGLPAQFRPALTTKPYYRSTYVFVTRKSSEVVRTFDDPRLTKMKIGVQIADDDYTPPAQALARRGMIVQLVAFETTGAQADSIIRAVASGKVDVAVVWGPLAGYYARRQRVPLTLTPVHPESDGLVPFTFEISMAVRKRDAALQQRVEQAIARRRTNIERILKAHGVPLLRLSGPRVAD